jgi:hypothetical protein
MTAIKMLAGVLGGVLAVALAAPAHADGVRGSEGLLA